MADSHLDSDTPTREELEEALSMVSCPYYRDEINGVCNQGCHQEPACMVNAPLGGWGVVIDAAENADEIHAEYRRLHEQK